jgi:hypothetical protein
MRRYGVSSLTATNGFVVESAWKTPSPASLSMGERVGVRGAFPLACNRFAA